jgi:integrase
MDAQTKKSARGEKTIYPGIWRRPDGGFLIRASVPNPATGRRVDRERILSDADLDLARAAQLSMEEDLNRIVRGQAAPVRDPDRFEDYARRWLRGKIESGDLRSNATHKRYTKEIERHLIPTWGAYYVNKITRPMVQKWRDELGAKCVAGTLKPATVNGWIKTFRQIVIAATHDYDEMRDPTLKIPLIDTTLHRTYTVEEPNSLLPSEVPVFMQKVHELYPHLYACIFLMFLTGRRPCEMRALRRRGVEADIRWDEGILLIRRSQTIGDPMNRTKTGRDLEIFLPPGAMAILKRHVADLGDHYADPENGSAEHMRASDLLFPPARGRYMSEAVVYLAIRDAAVKAGFKKKITPKAARRTFTDLCRYGDVEDFIRESVSGHATAEMKRLYSTAAQNEIRGSLDRVLQLGGFVAAAGLPAMTEAA